MLGLNYSDVWATPLAQLHLLSVHALRDFLATCSPGVRATLQARFLPDPL